MSKIQKFLLSSGSILSFVFVLFPASSSFSMEEDELYTSSLQYKKQNSQENITKKEEQEKYLSKLFDNKRESMEKANKRVKKRLKIDSRKKIGYVKKK